jgi:hypothetical protein
MKMKNRVEYVRDLYTDEVAACLLTSDGFTASRDERVASLAGEWRKMFEQAVRDGYMRKSDSGHYWWFRYGIEITGAGPSALSWFVRDLTAGDCRIVKGGQVAMPADHTQEEINEADRQARQRALSAIVALNQRAA